MKLDLLLRGGKVVLPSHGVIDAEVGVSGGRISVVAERGLDYDAAVVQDVTGLHIFPGVVDPHAHVGFGNDLDEYRTDTGAATLGGVTTVSYILINSGSYLNELPRHLAAIRAHARTDIVHHLTLMSPQHLTELRELKGQYGITSFKYFMSFRGEEGAYLGVDSTDDGVFYTILEAVRDVGGTLAVHPENIEVVWKLREQLQASGADGLTAWNASRPPFTEAEAIARASYLGAATGCPIYFVHVSSGEALGAVREARRRFPEAKLFAETCPHFLTHTVESPVGVLGKVNPPLRERQDLEALWDGVLDGSIDTIGSDHAGRLRETKQGSIWKVSAGFPGLPTILPVLLSEGYHKRGVPLERIAALTAANPASIYGLGERKGDIRPGMDADFAIVDLDWAREPDADWLGTYSDYSLYEGWSLKGWPRQTYVRGTLVQQDGRLTGAEPVGQYIPRPSDDA